MIWDLKSQPEKHGGYYWKVQRKHIVNFRKCMYWLWNIMKIKLDCQINPLKGTTENLEVVIDCVNDRILILMYYSSVYLSLVLLIVAECKNWQFLLFSFNIGSKRKRTISVYVLNNVIPQSNCSSSDCHAHIIIKPPYPHHCCHR